jgi:dynein heavy chain
VQHLITGEFSYCCAQGEEQLSKTLETKLEEYNNNLPAMNLVLFKQAIEHICRISRIVQKNCGNALLLGVGGSGKQSLAKLAT